MIFVSVGTQIPFDRLLKSVEKQIIKGNIKEEVVVQAGQTNYTSDLMKIINFIEMDNFKKYIKDASLIICHGGVGTIIDGLKNNKIVIACPRLKKFGEAKNDHQMQIINNFSESGYIISLADPKYLNTALKKAKNFKPKKYISNTKKFVTTIENFIENN